MPKKQRQSTSKTQKAASSKKLNTIKLRKQLNNSFLKTEGLQESSRTRLPAPSPPPPRYQQQQ